MHSPGEPASQIPYALDDLLRRVKGELGAERGDRGDVLDHRLRGVRAQPDGAPLGSAGLDLAPPTCCASPTPPSTRSRGGSATAAPSRSAPPSSASAASALGSTAPARPPMSPRLRGSSPPVPRRTRGNGAGRNRVRDVGGEAVELSTPGPAPALTRRSRSSRQNPDSCRTSRTPLAPKAAIPGCLPHSVRVSFPHLTSSSSDRRP